MTEKELTRANVLGQLLQGTIQQENAAALLGITSRHLRRLYTAYKSKGIFALKSLQRGKPSNHQLPENLANQVKEIVSREIYRNVRPTFMSEILATKHSINISKESVRRLMIQAGVWQVHKQKKPVIHQQRKRRAHFGELIQGDSSPHAWFEDRGEPCVLSLFVDDATGKTLGLFRPTEDGVGYMTLLRQYIMSFGRPIALYVDKHSIFRINHPGCLKSNLTTQFGRACKELEIQLICANSPQAKGRVERANQTHQDRLVIVLRLAGINTIEEGNQFLPGYFEAHNTKFGVQAEDPYNAHRPTLPHHNLDRILCFKDTRKVSKNLEIQYNNVIYQIIAKDQSRTLCYAKVTILESLNGDIAIEYEGKQLEFKEFFKQECSGKIINAKEIDRFLQEKKSTKPSPNHPWRNSHSNEMIDIEKKECIV